MLQTAFFKCLNIDLLEKNRYHIMPLLPHNGHFSKLDTLMWPLLRGLTVNQ